MADNFERHRSTRWVKADVPSYGDQWGDEYDNYDNYDQDVPEDEIERRGTEKRTSATPNLVLSIDNVDHRFDYDDDDDSEQAYSQPPLAISEPKGGSFRDTESGRPEDSESSDEDVSYIPESPDRERFETEESKSQADSGSRRPEALDTSATSLKDDFVPPTPTFSQSNFSNNMPETPVSDRSFVSDADSIQREPETLNVAGRYDDSLNEIQEDPQLEGAATRDSESEPRGRPLELVLSVDRLNLEDSDSSDDSDSLHFNNEEKAPTASTLALGNQEHDNSQADDSVDSPLHVNLPDLPGERRPVKTDALDSLIDDLQKMERLSTYGASSSSVNKQPQSTQEKDMPPPPPAKDSEEQGDDNLPSLASIHDMSLPNFEDHSFSDLAPETSNILEEITPELQEEVQKAHELYVSQLQAHNPSVKKAPPQSPNIDLKPRESETEAPVEAPSTPKQQPQDTDLLRAFDPNNPLQIGVPVLSPESISTKHLSGDFTNMPLQPPQPPRGPAADMLRRDSTMTTSTFNMGNWKPNTSIYRDQFVNDNDNESQMNFSVYNGKDNYDKFVGARSSLGYAESFTNSSTLSVPETVALPSIHEDTSDADLTRDDDDTSDDRSFTRLENSRSDGDLSLPGKDKRSSDGSIFKEEKLTLPGSLDQLPKDGDIDNSEKYKSISSVDSKSDNELHQKPERSGTKRLASSSSFGISKPPKQKYPVSKWKDLTSHSQPVDRIEAFKNAKQREIEYESGLQYWLQETLQKTEVSPNMHIGKLAEQAYQNATHTDIRRHTSMALNATSLRNKVSLVKDKMDTTAGFGRRFLNKGKKLMKS